MHNQRGVYLMVLSICPQPGFDPAEFENDVILALAGKDPLPSECYSHPGRTVSQKLSSCMI